MIGKLFQRKWRKLHSVKWVIIDEISIASFLTLSNITPLLQKFKETEELFGGINIILFGDSIQLPPVSNFFEIGVYLILITEVIIFLPPVSKFVWRNQSGTSHFVLWVTPKYEANWRHYICGYFKEKPSRRINNAATNSHRWT